MWYYASQGQQRGPISEEQLQAMVRDGSLTREDLVWREGMPAWQAAGEVAGLDFPLRPAYLPPPPPPTDSSPYAPPRYQAPPSSYAVPPPYGGAATAVPDYLPWAIAATLLCCMPGGIAAIVYANKANTAKRSGDFAAAQAAAAQAKTWLIVSVVFGLLFTVIAIVANIANLANLK
jgi:hypothetical protein